MIGIFDSGAGGLAALRKLRALLPNADICYLADRKNAPYGTKSQDELRRLVIRDIRILKTLGATEILSACCTASAVIDAMKSNISDGVTTIIKPTARKAASQTKNQKIALLCTYATAKSYAFEREILSANPNIQIKTQPTKKLVELVERGARDGRIGKSELCEIRSELGSLTDFGADTVVLGCTHFSLLKSTISSLLKANFVSAADEGAELLAKTAGQIGDSKTVYLCPEKIL